jgi:uncharacterized membrane protein
MIEIQPGYCIMWQQGLYIVHGITFFPYLINEYFVSILHTVGPELMHIAEMPYMMCVLHGYLFCNTFFSSHLLDTQIGTSNSVVPMCLLRFTLC